MKPLVDSTDLLTDGPALRERAARDGYVLVRGLLPAQEVEAAGAEMARTMADAGWIPADMPLANPVRSERKQP